MVGIGITTRNRPDVLEFVIGQFNKYYSDELKFVVVDDNSDEPDLNRRWAEQLGEYQFNEERLGIAKSKNECIKLLNDVDHILLFDDDCFPIKKNWWVPWTEGAEHMVYALRPLIGRKALVDNTIWWNGCLGCCLYFSRHAIDVLGGFDKRFKIAGFEHVEITGRAKRAGLIPHPYITPRDTGVWSFDASGDFDNFVWQHKASMTHEEKQAAYKENTGPYNEALLDKTIYRAI
jgi:GT2 family glycosyltransferase